MTPVDQPKLHYKAVLESDESDRVTSLIAYQVASDQPLRAVMWSARRQEWIYAPAIAAGILFDDMRIDQTRTVDRGTAETLASDGLGTTLPDERTLREMYREGADRGLRFGPPL